MEQQLLFVVGCARSGTTWLQLLLSQHPAIATLQETHLFPDYISPAFSRWRRESEAKSATGLTNLMDRARFLELWRRFTEQTLSVALTDKPSASFILEKTPSHVHHAQEILELFPSAYFVHIIRDPRAVVASLLDAGRSWARGWAPRSSLPAADLWRNAVTDGKRIAGLTPRYLEVSYEKMLAKPEPELARILEMIGLGPDPDFCRRAAETCAVGNTNSGAGWKPWVPKTMENIKGIMVRKAKTDSWRTELTRFQIGTIEARTSDLLDAYGYTPEVKPGPVLAVRLRLSEIFGKFSHRLGRRLRGALKGA
jgi:hypothetical protein